MTDSITQRINSASLEGLSLDERLDQAKRYGVRNAGKTKLQLNRLRESGVLVDLFVGGTSLFSSSAIWPELGVMDERIKKFFTKGTKSLAPKVSAKLKSNETRLRQELDKHSFDIAGFRPWRLVLWNAYESWRESHDRLVDERNTIMLDALENYDHYRDQAIVEFSEIAHASWVSIVGQEYTAAIIDGKAYEDEVAFVGAVVHAMLIKFPEQERIEKEIVAYYSTSLVYGEEDVASDRLAAEQIRQEVETVRAEAEKVRLQIKRDEKESYNLALHEDSLRRLERQEKELKIEAMKQAEVEHARDYLDTFGSPYIEIIQQMREQFAKDAENILKSIKKNGYVHGKVAERGRGLLDLYGLLAAHDDNVLKEKLEALRAQIGDVGVDDTPYRNLNDIRTTLVEIKDLASASVDELTHVSREAFVEI